MSNAELNRWAQLTAFMVATDLSDLPAYDPNGVVRVLVHARCPVLTLLD